MQTASFVFYINVYFYLAFQLEISISLIDVRHLSIAIKFISNISSPGKLYYMWKLKFDIINIFNFLMLKSIVCSGNMNIYINVYYIIIIIIPTKRRLDIGFLQSPPYRPVMTFHIQFLSAIYTRSSSRLVRGLHLLLIIVYCINIYLYFLQ